MGIEFILQKWLCLLQSRINTHDKSLYDYFRVISKQLIIVCIFGNVGDSQTKQCNHL